MIAEGSTKLASVPSGGAGGAAPAAGGAAAGGAAAAEEKEEEKKEEGMLYLWSPCLEMVADSCYREGGVRRGYGLRSFRLNGQSMCIWKRRSRYFNMNGRGLWKELCELGRSLQIMDMGVC